MSETTNIGFRKAMTPLHNWGGLVVGWVLYFIFVTGTLGYFDAEIDRWTRPEVPLQQVSAGQSLAFGLARLQQVAPDADSWTIGIPASRNYPNLKIFWHYQQALEGKDNHEDEYLDAETGAPIQTRDTDGAQTLYRMHYNLHYVSRTLGRYLVGAASMFMLVAIITGIVIHKKIFKDFFTFRPKKGQRSWLDVHNMLSVLALPFHLMITYSGLLFYAFMYMPSIMLATYGAGQEAQEKFTNDMFSQEQVERVGESAEMASLLPMLQTAEQRWGTGEVKSVRVEFPNDANARVTVNGFVKSLQRRGDQLVFDGVSGELIQEGHGELKTMVTIYLTFLGLHEGHFADLPLRWLYFLSGVMGSAMIAAGLVLWSVKRNAQLAKHKKRSSTGHRLVEVLNIGTIIGLPVGIAAFFWANRLLPLGLEQRAEWEIHVLFIAWVVMLLFAWLRPVSRAWTESLWIGVAAFALIPLINALTTNRHLGHSLATGDWVFAGFDLSMLVTGMGFALAAWLRHQKVKSFRTTAHAAASPQPSSS